MAKSHADSAEAFFKGNWVRDLNDYDIGVEFCWITRAPGQELSRGCKLRVHGWTPQDAAHLYMRPWVGDGAGRTRELATKDEKWCEAVARFVR